MLTLPKKNTIEADAATRRSRTIMANIAEGIHMCDALKVSKPFGDRALFIFQSFFWDE